MSAAEGKLPRVPLRNRRHTILVSSSARLHGLNPPPCSLFLRARFWGCAGDARRRVAGLAGPGFPSDRTAIPSLECERPRGQAARTAHAGDGNGRQRTGPGAMEHATAKHLIEGHARFCRGCGHDLVGLTGCTCPRCGRVSNPKEFRRRGTGPGASGKRLVATLLVFGVVMALVALKFRRPPARRGVPQPGVEHVRPAATATAPLTRPVRGREADSPPNRPAPADSATPDPAPLAPG